MIGKKNCIVCNGGIGHILLNCEVDLGFIPGTKQDMREFLVHASTYIVPNLPLMLMIAKLCEVYVDEKYQKCGHLKRNHVKYLTDETLDKFADMLRIRHMWVFYRSTPYYDYVETARMITSRCRSYNNAIILTSVVARVVNDALTKKYPDNSFQPIDSIRIVETAPNHDQPA